MKKIVGLFLSLCMILGMLAVLPISVSAAGNITIANVDDWMSKLSGKEVGTANITVTADELDFTGKTVEPVQNFQGTFDGQGVVIKNLTITTEGETGMFNCLTGASTFKNFAILDSTFQGKEWVGCIVCCTKGDLTIENVYIADSVNVIAAKNGNNSYAGGLVGGCTDVNDTDPITVTISNCVFAGTVTAEARYNGGLIGESYDADNIIITNCLVTGKVPGDKDRSCGFIGDSTQDDDTITMTNCIYAGGAEDDWYYNRPFFRSATTAVVTDCYTAFANDNGKVYNDVAHTDENSGVTLVENMVTELVGANATVTLDGWTKRDRDIMLPTTLVTMFGDKIPSSSDRYMTQYTVTWANEDGTVLATEEYDMGVTPEYKGATPTKADDDKYTYTFSGWTPAVAAVSADVTYTAEFYKTRKNVVVEDNDTTTAPVTTEAPATTEATTDGEDEGGCGSAIGGALAIVLMLGGAAVVSKKKED